MILSNYPKIDLHGFDRDYASIMVKDFIKDNYILGNKSIVIIHGKGTGALREEIQKFLKATPGVAAIKDEDIQLGGSGVTVISFK